MSTGITTATRRLVLARDLWCCVSCGIDISSGDYSIQHRIPRGMGGTHDPKINAPGNLLCVCGSATTGCHEWMESHRLRAHEWGYLVFRSADPVDVPVLTADGWVLYDNDGTTRAATDLSPDLASYDVELARLERLGTIGATT